MPVNTTKSSKTFQGNGVTQAWSCDFRIFASTDVTVAVIDQVAGTSTPLSLGSDFTVSGANDDGGFTVNTTVPVASGKNLLVKRVIAFTQPTSFTNQGRFFPALHQDMADRLEMQIQQINDTQGRFLQFPDGVVPEPDGELPVPQPSSILGWSEDGTRLVNTGPTGVGAGQLTDINISNSAGINSNKLSFFGSFGGAVVRTVLAKLRAARVSSDDYGTVTQAATASNVVQVDSAVNGAGASIVTPAVADAAFRGKGTITGVYRKMVIPENASSDALSSVDIVPAKHLKQMNLVAKPTVVLLGDSISTYFANSIARSDMLYETLRRTLNRQFPSGVTLYNRSIAGQTFSGVFTTVTQNAFPWATSAGKVWLDYVKDLAPDLVVLSFGMNDTSFLAISTLNAIITATNGWTKKPSIVFATNLIPNPTSVSFPEGEAGQINRDLCAGYVRSFAKYNGLGVLDMHRKSTMVRDGYDPISTCIVRGDTISATVAGAATSVVGSRKTRDFKLRVGCTATGIDASNYLLVRHGPGVNDFFQLTRPNGTTLQCAVFAGQADAAAVTTVTGPFTAIAGSYVPFVVEVANDWCNIYDDNSNFGQNVDPIISFPLVRGGGEFFPACNSPGNNVIQAADFSYSEYRPNEPSVINSLMWGDGTSSIDVHGGSGWNHPGGLMATHVYRPVIEGVQWYDPQPVTGTVFVAATGTTFSVTLPTAELTNSYNIIGSWEGGAAPGWAVGTKTTTGFTITLVAAAGQAIQLKYQLIRL